MKRLLPLTLCAIILLMLLTGCSAQKETDMTTLRETMLSAAEFPAMLSAGFDDKNAERDLTVLTDIDYDKVAEYFIEYAADGSAYEIAVIRVKDASDVDRVKKDLQKHIDHRTEQYRYYMPEQVANAEHAAVTTRGKDIALIMCDDPSPVISAFNNTFN